MTRKHGVSTRWIARLSAGLLLSATVGGCSTTAIYQGLEPGNESGLITDSVSTRTVGSLDKAYIYEIDGETVPYTRGTHRLSVGPHTVRVWPKEDAAASIVMIPDTVRIERDQIRVEALTIDVEAGYRYYVAARTNITRTRSTIGGGDVHAFEPEMFIVPVVVKEVAPVSMQEAAKGAGFFLGALLLGPLLGPGL